MLLFTYTTLRLFGKKNAQPVNQLNVNLYRIPLLKLDKQLLDIWGNNLQLTLMEQDEELLLAEVEYLPMILQAIDEKQYLPAKINTLP